MNICPLCQTPRTPGADICGVCKVFRFPSAESTETTSATLSGASLFEAARATIVEAAPPLTPVPVPTQAATPHPAPDSTNRFPTPRLVVIRGLRVGAEFPLYNGPNYLGRTADKPEDIDLTGQEPADQVWSSRRHAVITLDRGKLLIDDLNSTNGTFLNRGKLQPGKKQELRPGDIIVIGTVHLKLEV